MFFYRSVGVECCQSHPIHEVHIADTPSAKRSSAEQSAGLLTRHPDANAFPKAPPQWLA